MTEDELEQALVDYALRDMNSALVFFASCFVGLLEAYCELNGGESHRAIRISDPTGGRSITVHEDKSRLH